MSQKVAHCSSSKHLSRLSFVAILALFLHISSWAANPQQRPHHVARQDSSDAALAYHVTPDKVTIGANQRQKFDFHNGAGEPVAATWKITGANCLTGACGHITNDGSYRAPHSLSQRRIVMLEAIPVSDPEHSVWAQINLSPTLTAVVISAAASSVSRDADSSEKAVARKTRNATPPPGPTIVTYEDHQLSIDADNQTLADVLQLVAQRTGATIDIPPGSGLERIVEHIGPGPAKDVLSQMLNGSNLNFVIMSDPQDPDGLQEVVLSPQEEGNTNAVATSDSENTPASEVAGADSLQPVAPTPVASGNSPDPGANRERIAEWMRERARIRENAEAEQEQQPPPDQQQPEQMQAQPPAQQPPAEQKSADQKPAQQTQQQQQ